jgi:lysophospholipase L1-like esterase
LLSMILVACGGGGGGSTAPTPSPSSTQTPSPTPTPTPTPSPTPTPTPSPTPTPNNNPRIVDYYGDSTIRGCETNTNCSGQAPITAPQAFDSELTTLAVTYSHTVNNFGVNGTDACQLLAGEDSLGNKNGFLPWAQQLAASTATHVIINHGINDLIHAQNGQGGPDADHSIATYQQCLTSLAQAVKNANKIMIFETPNPIKSSVGDLTPYVQAMKNVAASMGAPVIDQFTYLSNKYQGQIAQIVPDGLHPTDSVYVDKGQFAARAFTQACGNFTCSSSVVDH